MTKHLLSFLFFLLSICLCIYSQSLVNPCELEQLWLLGRKSNIDITNHTLSTIENEVYSKYFNSIYKPYFDFSISPEFSNVFDNVELFPTSINSILTVKKTLPGEAELIANCSYILNRYIMDGYIIVDSNAISYYHTSSFNLNLTQSLNPYWRQGEKKNPVKAKADISILKSLEELRLKEIEVMNLITLVYIQMRLTQRKINVIQKNIHIQDQIILAFSDLVTTGSIDITTVWKEEEVRRDKEYSLYVLMKEYESLLRKLELYCGETLPLINGLVSTNAILPENVILGSSFDHSTNLIKLENEQNRLDLLLAKQTFSPKISFGGSISITPQNDDNNNEWPEQWNNEKTVNWGLRLSIDLSSIFSPELMKTKELLTLNSTKINMRKKNLDIERYDNVQYYNKMIKFLTKQQYSLEKSMQTWKNAYKDSIILYNKGACSYTDTLNSDFQVYTKECEIANTLDEIWYYRYLLENITPVL